MLKLLAILYLISFSSNQPCNEYCISCVNDIWTGIISCKECRDGYFLDTSTFMNEGCIKQCAEGTKHWECKICNYEEKDECEECWTEHGYKLDEDKINCIPTFVVCGNETFSDCDNCEKKINITGGENQYRCTKCRTHYSLVGDYCEYDPYYTGNSNYININSFLIVNLLIVILFL